MKGEKGKKILKNVLRAAFYGEAIRRESWKVFEFGIRGIHFAPVATIYCVFCFLGVRARTKP